ncbi:hypothetical protein [Paenibacillus sp. MMS20-IR301]|uniref:hypothetical protein n=1 Tax=Paenibacillus sp. MMS20-IR301 TaxID=2895946 RepID=UPI0028EFD4EC|nr:hypothetical protein [Paenibacillus sp. MMS20-IR301]WNS45415.1 hypothetical protein LOS79_09135 [Paenibacillus sp. MMS20-IR301]
MKSVGELQNDYRAIEERVLHFITEHSSVEYVQDSEKVVEGGAFSWASLNSEDEILQTQLRIDYVTVAELARQKLELSDSKYLIDFDRSSEAVLGYIRQNSMLWIPSLAAAAEAAKIEIDLQKFLLAQA